MSTGQVRPWPTAHAVLLQELWYWIHLPNAGPHEVQWAFVRAHSRTEGVMILGAWQTFTYSLQHKTSTDHASDESRLEQSLLQMIVLTIMQEGEKVALHALSPCSDRIQVRIRSKGYNHKLQLAMKAWHGCKNMNSYCWLNKEGISSILEIL